MKPLNNIQPAIDMQGQEPLKCGKQRDIFLLDADQQVRCDATLPCVLKVPRYGERQRRQSPVKRLIRALFPGSAHRIITKEVDYIRKLNRKRGAAAASLPLPAFMGFVQNHLRARLNLGGHLHGGRHACAHGC